MPRTHWVGMKVSGSRTWSVLTVLSFNVLCHYCLWVFVLPASSSGPARGWTRQVHRSKPVQIVEYVFSRVDANELYQSIAGITISSVFTTRCHASVIYAIVMCLSVRSRCCTETAKPRITQQCHMIAQVRGSSFLMLKISAKLKWVTPNGGAKCGRVG